MPTLPAAGNVVAIKLQHNLNGKIVSSNFFHSYTGGHPSISDCNAIASAVNTNWSTNIKAYLASAYKLAQVEVFDLSSNTAASGIYLSNTSGGLSGQQNPASVSTLLHHQIARRYRGGKPRTYMPYGITTHVGSGNQWLSTYVTSFQTAVQAFIAANATITSGTTVLGGHVNVSYYSGYTWVPVGTSGRTKQTPTVRSTPLVEAIMTTTVSPNFGSQRKRNYV